VVVRRQCQVPGGSRSAKGFVACVGPSGFMNANYDTADRRQERAGNNSLADGSSSNYSVENFRNKRYNRTLLYLLLRIVPGYRVPYDLITDYR
jgi:hypothetical protein